MFLARIGRTNARVVFFVVLAASLALSIATFFTALSQYPTADQNVTFDRLHKFLSDPWSVSLVDGSLLSDLVVAVPGRLISKAINSVYHLNDTIVGAIHSTPYLPFAIAQVLVALVLIAMLTRLFVNLAQPERPNRQIVLFALVIVLNFPMLKAVSKVLKYDILSATLSAIAVLLYIGYRKYGAKPPSVFFGRHCVRAIGICCGMAYIEKDTTLSTALLIIFLELIAIPLLATGTKTAVKEALRFLGNFSGAFLIAAAVLVPKVWANPLIFHEFFANLHLYFVNFPKVMAPLAGGLLVLLYAVVANRRRFRNLSAVGIAYLWVLSAVIFVLVISALIFQKNIIFDPMIAGNGLNIEALRAHSIYISKPMANTSMTTLDRSALMTDAKLLFSMLRSIVYTLPEISVLMVVGAAPIFLLLARRKRELLEVHGAAFILLSIFPAALLLVLALVEVPLDPKYLLLVNLLITLYGTYPALLAFKYLEPAAADIAKSTICALTIVSVLPAGPAYLGYKNLFRDRAVDNAAALDMDHFIWWMWAGWGETAYAIGRYVEQHGSKPTTVAYDYLPPFYSAPGITWIAFDFAACNSVQALEAALINPQLGSADYLIVSKNKSNRNWCENQILRRTKDKAVFVDVRQGFEYGWLFRVSDVIAMVRK